MAKWLSEGVTTDAMCGNFLMVKVKKETKGEMVIFWMCFISVGFTIPGYSEFKRLSFSRSNLRSIKWEPMLQKYHNTFEFALLRYNYTAKSKCTQQKRETF